MISKVAVYTTVYPGVEPFLAQWLQSLKNQTDRSFALWVAVDGLDVETVLEAMGGDLEAQWVRLPPGQTPAQIRQRAWAQLCEAVDAVILVDSDDIMHATRVEAGRRALEDSDFAGCALRLVDAEGAPLEASTFALPGRSPESVLPRHNVLGLSNSAIRTSLLRRLLPVPSIAEAVDWYLATRAWMIGARFAFDSTPRMDYRQHGNNLTQVRGPYSVDRIKRDTSLALRHFALVSTSAAVSARAERREELARICSDVERFHREVVLDETKLNRYIERLNALALPPLWWACVAYPPLRDMWDH